MRSWMFAVLILAAGLQLGAASPRIWRCSHPGNLIPRGIYCSCGFRPNEKQGFHEHVATFLDQAKKNHQLSNWISCRHCAQHFCMPHKHQFASMPDNSAECAGNTQLHLCACGEKSCLAPN